MSIKRDVRRVKNEWQSIRIGRSVVRYENKEYNFTNGCFWKAPVLIIHWRMSPYRVFSVHKYFVQYNPITLCQDLRSIGCLTRGNATLNLFFVNGSRAPEGHEGSARDATLKLLDSRSEEKDNQDKKGEGYIIR
jgi:hypothetical protein